jgi:membrane protein implicated in regulation of membrane protease activity
VHPFAKYLLLEVPGWILAGLIAVLLHRWMGLSPLAAGLIVALWIGKDVVLYRSVRDAYVAEGPSPTDRLLGRTGVVVEPLRPIGMVRLGGELWRAEPAAEGGAIPRGRRVRVEGVRGLLLSVAEETRDGVGRSPRRPVGPGQPDRRPQAPTASSPGEASRSGPEAGSGGSVR